MGRKKKNARRGNREGSLFQRQDGRWCGVVWLGYKPDGKPNRKMVYGKTYEEAQQKKKELESKTLTGFTITNKALLGETMKNWLRVYKKPLVSSRTYEHNVRTFKNHIEPNLGNLAIDKVTTNIVQELLTKSLEEHNGSPNTPKRIKFLLNQFFEYLIEQGLANNNPTLRCKISSRHKKTFIDSKGNLQGNSNYKAIPEKERLKFIRALEEAPDLIKPLSLVMMLASLRVGEALALKWENIDFERGALFVEQGLTEEVDIDDDLNIVGRRDIISTTKTACSKRAIKMPELVIDALKKWRKIQWCKEQTYGTPLTKPSNLVFCQIDGSIRGYDAVRRMFDRFTKKHGFRQEFGIHCHMLRQTFSNMQIEANRNIKKVQHLLGHKDAKTTQLHYNSVVDQELDYEGCELIDTLFNKNTLQNDLGENEVFIEKDIPAYHLEIEDYSNNSKNEKAEEVVVEETTEKTEEEIELEILQRMLEEKKKAIAARKKKDFEM